MFFKKSSWQIFSDVKFCADYKFEGFTEHMSIQGMTNCQQNGRFGGPAGFVPWSRVKVLFFWAGDSLAVLIRCILPKIIEFWPFLRTSKKYFAKGNVQNEEKLYKLITILWKQINSERQSGDICHWCPHFFGRIPQSTYQDMTWVFSTLRSHAKAAK